jgi:adenylate cyclase
VSDPDDDTDGPEVDDVDPIARGLLPILGLDHARFGLDEVAAQSGLDPEQLRDYWRALGFPDPRPGEKLFSDADAEMLAATVRLIDDSAVDPAVARQMARVIGSSLDRIAAAQIDAYMRRPEGLGHDRDMFDATLVIPRVLELVWRRRLAAEAQRRLVRAGAEDGAPVCVGFADLVGFTAQTQQLDTTALADVVGRFEAIAYDVVAEHGGRVVKTIGDEVMFVHDHPVQACHTALVLASRYREDEALSDVRVGLAWGPVLERDGDVYGHTVNLASRIVSVAYPGSVIVSAELKDAVSPNDELAFTSLRSHYLKDIGRIPLWRMRRADDQVEGSFRSARRDYAARQEVLTDHWARRRAEVRALAEDALGDVELDPDRLPARFSSVVRGTATPEELEGLRLSPTGDELEALAEVVLSADLDPAVQEDLLTELGVAQELRALEAEAEAKAAKADQDAERELQRIELETAAALEQIEREHEERVAEAIARATEASRRVDEQAAARLRRVAEEAARKADQATRDARAKARRAARQRTRRRGR